MKQRCFEISVLQISSSAMKMPRPHCYVILSCHKLQNTNNPESITDKSMYFAVQTDDYFHIDVTVSLWVIADPDVCELWYPSFWKKETLILMNLFRCVCLFQQEPFVKFIQTFLCSLQIHFLKTTLQRQLQMESPVFIEVFPLQSNLPRNTHIHPEMWLLVDCKLNHIDKEY